MPILESQISAKFMERTPTSRKLAERAQRVFPGGVTHDARYLKPYAVYVDRAQGPRKWDVDGNEYVDYVGGHGALLLGHNHPTVMEAVERQCARGTHLGASHGLELEWGEKVQQLVPSAERVRFTSSGTEATLLALRLVRAFTGKTKIVRFATNFHGWHDHMAFGVGSHFDGTPTPGVVAALADEVLLCQPGNIDTVRQILSERDDVAGVILEPTGATWGQVPIPESFLNELREATAAHEVPLIFDEVITGFRCAPGGAQAYYSVTPDVTTLAKVLAGGFPGGALVGRREILDGLDVDRCAELGREKIAHHGTFNASPVSAAAGIAALGVVAQTDACERASQYAARLRSALQGVLDEESVPWCVYGEFSGFHLFTNPDREAVSVEQLSSGLFDYRKIKAAAGSPAAKKLRLGMLAHGVDIFGWPGGPTSAVHGDAELSRTVEAFQQTVRIMKIEGDI